MASSSEAVQVGASSTTSSGTSTVDPSVLASKRVLHCGGLADQVTEDTLRAAFIPFGDIKGIVMPMDYVSGQKHKGFAFVEFEEAEDAEEAIYNRDGADFFGRTLRVSVAQPNQIHKLMTSSAGGGGGKGSSTAANQAVWKSDEWFQQYAGAAAGNGGASLEDQNNKEKDVETLR